MDNFPNLAQKPCFVTCVVQTDRSCSTTAGGARRGAGQVGGGRVGRGGAGPGDRRGGSREETGGSGGDGVGRGVDPVVTCATPKTVSEFESNRTGQKGRTWGGVGVRRET